MRRDTGLCRKLDMTITEWFRRLWYLLHRARIERELQQEMDAHREMMGERVRFGNTLRLREESRDVWGWNWLDALCRDIRHGLRRFRREPTFAAAAILTLALFLNELTYRADWQQMMIRFRTSGIESLRLFVNLDYLRNTPLIISVASGIGGVMGFIGGSLGRLIQAQKATPA